MYRTEVPLYGDLVDIVNSVDNTVLSSRGLTKSDLPPRHELERHGAIRLGTAQEMRLISRLFGIMGMYPVGYYDLHMVGFPLHGTAFRPTTEGALRKNPFRVFTTVLRPDLITDVSLRRTSMEILSKRVLFTHRLCQLMTQIESGSLPKESTDEFISESLKIFKWHARSTVPKETYLRLRREHPVVADIVCFPSAHINHLTPRTLDIDAVQAEMISRGLPAKECIEGPPGGRKCQILLRQTSFKALEERVMFVNDAHDLEGTHTARFGEVEQRGAAVTRKGRELYDKLLASAMFQRQGRDEDILTETFKEYPDDWADLRKQGLVYFRYKVAEGSKPPQQEEVQMEELIGSGVIEYEPITYEDFLPLSAAGIFTSNLGESNGSKKSGTLEATTNSRKVLEDLLGCSIPVEMDLYQKLQSDSLVECEKALGVKISLAA
ncbi:hypothetical protein QBC35DRAFT_484421 [Podospora australis]|uniref:2-oxoadipate dioxygenase/decarboxylase n=1 Tax=Podospora australis TaxID=1536484 RepID=A0AAN6X1Z6_9PEZI|nr:hypothetical protein QBC35DRAFT_484421 [Podospora australis]